jgi:hypothetical protein
VHRADGPGVELVLNDSGAPKRIGIGADPKSDPPARVEKAEKNSLPACAAAKDALYCADASGAIRRWRSDTDSTIVARARAGTDLAAATLGGHSLLAFLTERVTTEGVMREAQMSLDDGPPERLSEGGAGATFIDLAPRRDTLLAMTIDARVAMTPAHVRTIALAGDKAKLGEDAVIFVGGSAEPHNAGALATAVDGRAFALVAVENGAEDFGMAAIKVEDPPREDEPVTWSIYPNGLDPAPIAATRGGASLYVARVRPARKEPGSPRVLELGELDASGALRRTCIVTLRAFVKDVEIAADSGDQAGSLWVYYRAPGGGEIERRALPASK